MQFKSLIRYPIDIRRARKLLSNREDHLSSLPFRPIVLDLQTPQMLFDCGRHLASLAFYANQAGSRFYFRCNQLMLAAIARKIHGRELLGDLPSTWIPSSESLPEDSFVLSDAAGEGIQMMIGKEIDRRLPVMPYPMHPATLPHADQSNLKKLRQSEQRAGILFAGNQKTKYGDAKMQRQFGVLCRLEILSALSDRFAQRVITTIDGKQSADRIAIIDTRLHSIAAQDWLPTLSKFRFFVCCPGAAQPTCHNLIEAMSVGTIPIIEYGDRVTPELTDGQNAICFRGRDGLIDAVDRIARMTLQELGTISQNVARFYDNHLCGTKFLSDLRDGRLDLSESKICMPFHETNFYNTESGYQAESVARRVA